MIKSYKSGLSIYLDKEIPFPQLLNEVALKFKESKKFFQNSQAAIFFDGRVLTSEEEQQLVNIISESSDLEVLYVVGREDDPVNQYFNAVLHECNEREENYGNFYRGTLKDGQVLEMDSSVIILGDVYPGCTVISNKDIIILGALNGAAYAGAGGEEGHYVVALEMAPTKLKIADATYRAQAKNSIWRAKPKIEPKIAYLKNNQIYMDSITKELLSEIPI